MATIDEKLEEGMMQYPTVRMNDALLWLDIEDSCNRPVVSAQELEIFIVTGNGATVTMQNNPIEIVLDDQTIEVYASELDEVITIVLDENICRRIQNG